MRGFLPCIARQANCAAILPRGASHYVFDPEFCNPAASGQVEKSVRDARRHAKGVLAARRLWQVAPVFPDLAALNEWLEDRCKLLWVDPLGRLLRNRLPGNGRHMAHCPLLGHVNMPCQAMGSIADVWEAERSALMPLPTMFDGFVEERKRVSPTRCPAAHACMRERGPDHL